MASNSGLIRGIERPPQEHIYLKQEKEKEKGNFEQRKEMFKNSRVALDISLSEAHPVNRSVKQLMKIWKKRFELDEEKFNLIGKNDDCDGALIAAVYEMMKEEEADKAGKNNWKKYH